MGVENRKAPEKINTKKSWFFEKIRKIDKSLGRWIKKKIGKDQITKMRSESGVLATESTERKNDFYKRVLCAMNNVTVTLHCLDEMHKFLETQTY